MAKVSLRAYNREIETMIDRGQLDEAIAHCHHILKIFPKNLDTYRLLGKAYLESKRYGDTADIFLRILASVPNDFVAQVGMSIIRDEENKLDDAIWHMERAFETQPSNPAIQSELQRLYGRRDGVQPPRIRMTRGALAHMYVQGELYPQAISEIRSVLKDDPGRADMQALLARALYKSGSKNEAAEVASTLLKRYPYSLDGNRVLAEILGAERPENAQLYRQRVVELDPYAAQVTGTMFQSNEVPDAAVTLERLDWNGQPVSMQSDWGETKAIGLESGVEREEQPDWLKNSFGETKPSAPAQPTPASIFETPSAPQPAPAQPAEEIPDFLRAAGWGQSTGAFDESKSVFAAEESTSAAEPIAQGDLPDWVKAMKPPEAEPPQAQAAAQPQAPEEELPDWINNIGKGALSSAAPTDQFDWLNQPAQNEQPAPTSSNEQPDWMKGLGEPQPSAEESSEQPDWLKNLGSEPDVTPQPAQTETPDWLKGFDNEPAVSSTEAAAQPEWLKNLGNETEPAAEKTEDLDWLQQLASATPAAETPSNDFDFLNQLTEEPVLQTPETTSPPTDTSNLGVSEQERDDSFAWLESLAAKQGATEGLLTKPEDRLEEEPDWIKQAKGLSSEKPSAPAETPVSQPPMNVEELGKTEQEDSFAWLENLAAEQGATEELLTKPEDRLEEEPAEWAKQSTNLGEEQPSASVETPVEPLLSQVPVKEDELGKTEQERDDSFAWLENLAARQGATEGLLTKPEDRLEQEPEWVRQAKGLESQPSEPMPAAANLEDLGKSEQEQDDSFAWLENLAAKQGATEGLLTKPEDRLQQEPEWVKQAKDFNAPQPPAPVTPEPETPQPTSMDETGIWLRSLEESEKTSEPEPTADETAMWLKNLGEPEKPSEPEADETAVWLKSLEEEKISEFTGDETAMWLKNLEEEKTSQPEPAADETSMWLKNLDQEESAPEPAPAPEAGLPDWMQNIEPEETPSAETPVAAQEFQEQPVALDESKLEEENIPSWLAELDKEEEKPVAAAADDDLPAWLRAEESPAAKAEPTRPSDWKHVEETQPEIIYSPPLEEPKQPEIIYSPPLEETKQPVPEEPVSFEELQEKTVEVPEEKPVEPAPEPTPVRQPAAKPAPQPYKEPLTTRRATGMLVTPTVDPTLGLARNELSRSNIPGALESYARLIKKGRFLDEVIYDLREALYRYPVEVSIWQSLGDAYMRSNRLQDALDAYTKAEELLR